MSQNDKKYGFAAMSPERVRELGAQGNKIAKDRGTRYSFTPENRSLGGMKSGAIRRTKKMNAQIQHDLDNFAADLGVVKDN